MRGWLCHRWWLAGSSMALRPLTQLCVSSRYEIILNCETIDVFYYISGQKPVPPELDSPVMKKLQEYAFNHPVGKADPARYANEKKNYSN